MHMLSCVTTMESHVAGYGRLENGLTRTECLAKSPRYEHIPQQLHMQLYNTCLATTSRHRCWQSFRIPQGQMASPRTCYPVTIDRPKCTQHKSYHMVICAFSPQRQFTPCVQDTQKRLWLTSAESKTHLHMVPNKLFQELCGLQLPVVWPDMDGDVINGPDVPWHTYIHAPLNVSSVTIALNSVCFNLHV